MEAVLGGTFLAMGGVSAYFATGSGLMAYELAKHPITSNDPVFFPMFVGNVFIPSHVPASEFGEIALTSAGVLGVLAATFGAGGVVFFADGITHLVKPSRRKLADGSAYFRNCHLAEPWYTNRPSLVHRLFGKRVTPIESVTELKQHKGYTLLNGLSVTSVQEKKVKRRWYLLDTYTVTKLRGELGGEEVALEVKSDSRFADSAEKGGSFYLMGNTRYDADKDTVRLDLKQHGNAMK